MSDAVFGISLPLAVVHPRIVCSVCGAARQDFHSDDYWLQSIVACGQRRAIVDQIADLEYKLDHIRDGGWGH